MSTHIGADIFQLLNSALFSLNQRSPAQVKARAQPTQTCG